LGASRQDSVRCDFCEGVLGEAMLRTLGQIVALPDAQGSHACECGHPEMRLLPDGTFHCPACGAEVLRLEYGCQKGLARDSREERRSRRLV
jgi:hypothetical protein